VIKPDDPRQLAIDLLGRSTCHVQVAAVIADRHGIFSWGWNSSGRDGYGEHAEAAAIRRANKRRLDYATIYIAGKRSKQVMSRPCEECQKLLKKWGVWFTVYTLSEKGWREETLCGD
jgi:deoxycytidylate deaminase